MRKMSENGPLPGCTGKNTDGHVFLNDQLSLAIGFTSQRIESFCLQHMGTNNNTASSIKRIKGMKRSR